MKKFALVAFAIAHICALPFLCGSAIAEGPIFQVSTITALKQGKLDGMRSIRSLKTKGDFGMGTLTGLDGEMVVLNGVFYKIGVDGKVIKIEDSAETPFAVVNFFSSSGKRTVGDLKTKTAIEELLENRYVTKKDCVYAIKLHGVFDKLKLRSVPKQTKPYPTLAKVIEHQAVFNIEGSRGTLVGYRFPAFMSGVNVAGFHFHFISDDESVGGHVLDCSLQQGALEMERLDEFQLELPDGS